MTDWAAKWFEIRAEMGQSDLATMMYQDEEGPVHREHFHHREADGFGKIQSLLRAEGIIIQAPTRPLKRPSPFLHFYLLIKGLVQHPRLPHNPWKYFSPQAASGLPDDVSYWFLNPQENQKMKTLAKTKGLNLGFYIVSEIDQLAKKKLFMNPEDKGVWLSPVDLRGAFPNAPMSQNFVSFIVTELFGVDHPELVKKSFEKYKKDLRSGVYWAFWELANIGKWIGVAGMKWLVRLGNNKSFWMGSFSDLGIWNQESLLQSDSKNRRWIIAPPGSVAYPIGITTIEWCGNRSISIKVHPAICDRPSKQISDELISELKQLVQHS